MTRLRSFALFAAIAAIAMALGACGGSSKGDEQPRNVIGEATLRGVESGKLDLEVGVHVSGARGGDVDFSLSGPFQDRGKEELPELDIAAKAKGSMAGEDVDFEGGLVLLADRAFVEYRGADYEVDPTSFSFIKSALERAQRRNGADAGACQKAAERLDFADYVKAPVNEGSADVGGTETTHVSGDLDVPAALAGVVKLAEDPACRAEIAATGRKLPPKGELEASEAELRRSVKSAHIDLYVGDDDIVRKVVARVALEGSKDGSAGGARSMKVDLSLELDGVNEDQAIRAPSGAKPLNDLFLKLGINPIELLEAAGEGNIGDILKRLGGGSSKGQGGSGGGRQSYLECLKGVASAADLQKCEGLL